MYKSQNLRMSPPEIWGPAVWTLFHTLAEKIKPDAYAQLSKSLFGCIVQICKALPCPDCSRDASTFLARIKPTDYLTKLDFKNLMYLFHNSVNAKKRKPLYNYAYINVYAKYNLEMVVNNFIAKYNTKGNMRLLSDTFQRSMIVKNIMSWLHTNIVAFTNVVPLLTVTQPEPVPKVEQEPLEQEQVLKVEQESLEQEQVPKVEPESAPLEPDSEPEVEQETVPLEPDSVQEVEPLEPETVPKVEPESVPKVEPETVPKVEPLEAESAPEVEPESVPEQEPLEPETVPKVEPEAVQEPLEPEAVPSAKKKRKGKKG